MENQNPPSSDPYKAPAAPLFTPSASTHELIPNGRGLRSGASAHWIGAAWRLYASRPAVWIGLMILMYVIFVAASLIPFAGSFLNALIAPVIFGGIALGCVRGEGGDPIRISDLWGGLESHGNRLALLGVCQVVMYVIMFVIAMGAFGAAFLPVLMGKQITAVPQLAPGPWLILLVPVMIVLGISMAMLTYYAPYLVAVHNLPVFDALRMSFRGALKNLWPIFLTFLLLWLLMLASVVTLFLGFIFVIAPMMIALQYVAARDVFTASGFE